MNVLDRLEQQAQLPVTFHFGAADGSQFTAEVSLVDTADLRALLDVARRSDDLLAHLPPNLPWKQPFLDLHEALAPLLEDTDA